jgi:hypothetical protein
MHKLLMAVFALAILACSTGQCFAVLGDTEAELEKRYGKPLEVRVAPNLEFPTEKMLKYSKDGDIIIVELWRGSSALEMRAFRDGNGKPVDPATQQARVAAMLEANAQGSSWEAVGERPQYGMLQMWTRKDMGAMACVRKEIPNALEVRTSELTLARAKAAK